jgi:hypothetical protein
MKPNWWQWDLRKDKRQTCKKLDQVDCVLWWRHTTASTTSSEFIIYSSEQGSGIAKSTKQQFLGKHDLVVIGNRRNV